MKFIDNITHIWSFFFGHCDNSLWGFLCDFLLQIMLDLVFFRGFGGKLIEFLMRVDTFEIFILCKRKIVFGI